MSTGAIVAIAVVALVVLAAIALLTTMRRADVRGAGQLTRETRRRDKGHTAPVVDTETETGREVERAGEQNRADAGTEIVKAAPLPPAPWTPPDPEVIGATRRHFLNISAITLMGVALSGFGAAVIAFLYPKQGGGFGSVVNAGKLDDIKSGITQGSGFYYLPEARTWITAYPADALPKAEKVYSPPILEGMKNGIAVLYQKCPHLGCRVPQCVSSQWFECPCHGSQYNQAGEKKGGPAPRGMDRFGVQINGGNVLINTQLVLLGPPIGTNTTGQEAEGPHCVGGNKE
jgi:cytochrome b6-f complex iron-sulfur subunit